MSKEALRREIRRLKQQYTPSQLEELSGPIIARLRPLLTDARVVLAYYSLPDEVFTHQLVDDLVAEGKTVLLPRVVDDTTMNLMVFKKLLKQTEVKIDTAASGDEGIALSHEKKYDIIFLDHRMPEMDGV